MKVTTAIYIYINDYGECDEGGDNGVSEYKVERQSGNGDGDIRNDDRHGHHRDYGSCHGHHELKLDSHLP